MVTKIFSRGLGPFYHSWPGQEECIRKELYDIRHGGERSLWPAWLKVSGRKTSRRYGRSSLLTHQLSRETQNQYFRYKAARPFLNSSPVQNSLSNPFYENLHLYIIFLYIH